jgi:hypothetical protein
VGCAWQKILDLPACMNEDSAQAPPRPDTSANWSMISVRGREKTPKAVARTQKMDHNRDLFSFHPELRYEIADPLQSFFRTFTTADLAVKMSELGLPKWLHSDEKREAMRVFGAASRLQVTAVAIAFAGAVTQQTILGWFSLGQTSGKVDLFPLTSACRSLFSDRLLSHLVDGRLLSIQKGRGFVPATLRVARAGRSCLTTLNPSISC